MTATEPTLATMADTLRRMTATRDMASGADVLHRLVQDLVRPRWFFQHVSQPAAVMRLCDFPLYYEHTVSLPLNLHSPATPPDVALQELFFLAEEHVAEGAERWYTTQLVDRTGLRYAPAPVAESGTALLVAKEALESQDAAAPHTVLISGSWILQFSRSPDMFTWFDPTSNAELRTTGCTGLVLGLQFVTDMHRPPALKWMDTVGYMVGGGRGRYKFHVDAAWKLVGGALTLELTIQLGVDLKGMITAALPDFAPVHHGH